MTQQPDNSSHPSLTQLAERIEQAAAAGKHSQPVLAEKVQQQMANDLGAYLATLAEQCGVEMTVSARPSRSR